MVFSTMATQEIHTIFLPKQMGNKELKRKVEKNELKKKAVYKYVEWTKGRKKWKNGSLILKKGRIKEKKMDKMGVILMKRGKC